MAPWTLVSPASRGIGFALTRHMLKTTNAPVIATARTDIEHTREKLVQGLERDVDEKRLSVLQLDVLDEGSISAAAEACKSRFPQINKDGNGHHLHLAFIIPGILHPEKSPQQIDADKALLTFRTNTLGPMLMLKHFEQFLPKKRTQTPRARDDTEMYKGLPAAAVTALMSARVGSISDNRLGGWYAYRASKAAVNQVVKTIDNHLKGVAGDKALCVGLHPGTVKTEFTREFWEGRGMLGVEECAGRLVGVVKSLGSGEIGGGGGKGELGGRGRCWDWEGKEVLP